MVGDGIFIEEIHRYTVTINVYSCETDGLLHSHTRDVLEQNFDEFAHRVTELRQLVGDYVAARFDFPVYLVEVIKPVLSQA